uniref:Uncharacterized protein n=1 Tax=Anguilla anguilla TaxID=7936 RepID=A0A0E9QV94_ANGAN
MSVMGPLMTTVSQDLGLTSHPKDGISHSTEGTVLFIGLLNWKNRETIVDTVFMERKKERKQERVKPISVFQN